MSKILLFGGSGQIGKILQRHRLPNDWQLFAPTRGECDFMEPNAIAQTIQKVSPHLVINAAAMTDIDACQKNKDHATEVNFHAVANIAAQCSTIDAPLIQLSTDYVFDGQHNSPYLPEDAMNPSNIYGATKMMGEEAVRHALHWHVILRTSLVFSAIGNNILTKSLKQINTLNDIQAVNDQIANPTSALAVCEAIIIMAQTIMNGKVNGFGTFHICSEPAVTRFEFLQAIMQAYEPFTDRRPQLLSVATAQMPNRVPRPPYSSLNCEKINNIYSIRSRPWLQDLGRAINDYVNQPGLA